MSTRIPIGAAVSPTHLECFVFNTPKPPPKENLMLVTPTTINFFDRLESYAGWIGVGVEGGGTLSHGEIISFVPTGHLEVRSYEAGSIISATVTASVSGFQPAEDEANIVALDMATVRLENQVFPGIGGEQPCLILRAKFGALNCTFLGITYQINILSRISPLDFDSNTENDVSRTITAISPGKLPG